MWQKLFLLFIMAILVSISMFLIYKLLDRSLAQQKNNGCRVQKQFSSFHLRWIYFFLSHRRMINSWIQQQASSQFITLACTNPLKKALKYRHVVLQCFFFQASESHTYFKSGVLFFAVVHGLGPAGALLFTPPLTSRLHTGELSL